MNLEKSRTAGHLTTSDLKLDSLIIALSAGAVLGLILLARGNTLPMHSVNDRSRWATVYSLIERGTYQIDETPWPPTIDRVQLNGHFYSSKPPLLPTLLAGEYFVLKKLSLGKLNFHQNPEAVIRIIVTSVNLIPLVIFLILYSRLMDWLVQDSWVRTYAMAAAGLGTYLTAFSITLNNHTIAAFSSFFALYPALLIWCKGRREWWLFSLAGFFAAFTAVNELPAVAFLLALGAGLTWRATRRTLIFFLPFALIPIVAHFWTNYLATGNFQPVYANKAAYDFPGSYWKIDPATGRLAGSTVDPATGQVVINKTTGIDNQYEPWPVYLFHMLLGHHGIFSLTPIFFFSFLGLLRLYAAPLILSPSHTGLVEASQASTPLPGGEGMGVRGQSENNNTHAAVFTSPRPAREPENSLKVFGLLATGLTLLLLVFYIFFAGQRNYGGMCNGLRWIFWLIPLWLIFLPLGIEGKVSSPRFRGLALVCLFISAASVFYATRNPWTRPWLHEFMYYMKWISY